MEVKIKKHKFNEGPKDRIFYCFKITTSDPYEKLVLKEMLSQPEISEIREEYHQKMFCVERRVQISPGGNGINPDGSLIFAPAIRQEFPFGRPEHLKKLEQEIIQYLSEKGGEDK